MADIQSVLPLFYSIGGVYDDTLPTSDEKMAALYLKASQELTKYREGGINELALKQFAEQLKAEAKLQESLLDAYTDLQETAGKDRRVTAEQATRLRMNQSDNRTKIAINRAQYSSTSLNPALGILQTGDQAGAYAQMFDTFGTQNVNYKRNDPTIAALADQMAVKTFGKGIDEIDPAQAAVQISPNNQQLQFQIREFFTYGKDANAAATGATRDLDATEAEMWSIVGAGGPLTDEQIARLDVLAEKAKQQVRTLIGLTPEEMKREEERIKSLDSRYRELQEKEALFRDLAYQPGQEGLRTRMGRLLANPEFRAWAEDNGFDIGQSRIDENGEVIYSQGRHDERAILAFDQQRRTGKPVGFLGTSNTGKRVRVTVTDPEERARLLEKNDITGTGQYAVLDGTVLSPEAYRAELRKSGYAPQGIDYAQTPEGDIYFRNAGVVYKYDPTNNSTAAIEGAVPAGLSFQPAVVFGADGKPLRYMGDADFQNLPAVLAENGVGFADDSEKKAIDAASPIKLVSADQLPSLGEMTFDGYLDKANARDIAERGPGVFSVNNGQYVFSPGAKIEVLETRGRGEPLTNSLERRAQRRAAGVVQPSLTPEQVRTARIREQQMQRAAAEAGLPPVSALVLDAASDPDPANAQARLESLVAGGAVSSAEVGAVRQLMTAAEAPAATAPAAAEPTRFFKDDAGYTFEVVDNDTVRVVGAPEGKPMPGKTEFKRGERAFDTVVTKLGEAGTPVAAPPAAPPAVPAAPTAAAPAPAAAPAAAAPAAKPAPRGYYAETSDGAQYRIDRAGVTMVAPPRGEVMPAQPKTIPFGSDEADAITERADLRILPPSEAEAVETRMAGLGKREPAPTPSVTERRGSTFIDTGARRTVGGDIREALTKAGQAVGGLFKKREAGEVEAAPTAGEAEKAERERKGLPPIRLPEFKRREQMKQQAAMAALPATDETLPEEGMAARIAAPTPVGALRGLPPTSETMAFSPSGEAPPTAAQREGGEAGTGAIRPIGAVTRALDIGKGRQAMGLLSRSTGAQDADLREKAAAIKAKEAEKPGSALAEVAALGREFRERQKRPAGSVTAVPAKPPAPSTSASAQFDPVTGEPVALEGTTTPRGLDTFRRFQKQAITR